MFSDNKQKNITRAKWIIGTVSVCILIYLGIRYISVLADSLWWLVNLILPILIGFLFALILDIPLKFFEDTVFTKKLHLKSQTTKRYLSILLSFVAIIGIFIFALFLILPELVQAIITLINIGTTSIENFSKFEQSMDYSILPFGSYLENLEIDWGALTTWLQDLLPSFMKTITDKLPTALGSSLGYFLDLLLGIIFSIYILAHKETFMKESKRMLRIWLPKKTNHVLLHIGKVCSESFRNFIAGQTMEAVILGTLCAVGMAILRLPYAPTIGVLVGVTAFIPYVGAYLGVIIGFIMILTIDPFKALIFVIFLVILQQIEGNVIYPKVVGNRINLPSFWVLAGLTIGGNLAGPIGMILGVPICSAIYNLINEATDWKEEGLLNKSKTIENEVISNEA